ARNPRPLPRCAEDRSDMASATLNDPLVAIVTPVYNGAKFLVETLDSVQSQTYPNLVHIVIDNASTDATPEILARYQHTRVPIEIRSNPQTLAIAENWNLAVSLPPATAKYFRVLSADDLIAPAFVSRMVALAEKHPNVVVVGCGLNHRGEPANVLGW